MTLPLVEPPPLCVVAANLAAEYFRDVYSSAQPMNSATETFNITINDLILIPIEHMRAARGRRAVGRRRRCCVHSVNDGQRAAGTASGLREP